MVVNSDSSLQELKEACVKVFFDENASFDDVVRSYDIAVIDGKSVVNTDEALNLKRRTFDFYWARKVCNDQVICMQQPQQCTEHILLVERRAALI